MHCSVYPMAELVSSHNEIVEVIVESLVWPESDFCRKLKDQTATGMIAVVSAKGRIAGWARTEWWEEPATIVWDTLEAFVDKKQRGNGVGLFACSALVPAYFSRHRPEVAVFSPAMMLLAHRIGLRPTMFKKEGDSWVRA